MTSADALSGDFMQNAGSDPDRQMMENFLRRPGFLLARVDQICTAIFTDLSTGPTLSQAEFLLLLDRLGPMIQIALARAAGVDKSTTAYIIDNLQARGWVERTVPDGDRRSQMISLTVDGQAIMPDVRQHFAELQRRLEMPFSAPELGRMIGTFSRIGQDEVVPAPPWRPACDPVTGVLDGALSFLTRRVLQMLHAQVQVTASGTRLTLRQFSLLFILSRRESITQTEFARMFGIDPATCAVIMRGPAKRGLIESEPCARDGRARIWKLTAAGRSTLAQVHPMVDRSEAIVFRREKPEDVAALVAGLRNMVDEYSYLLRFPGALSA